MKNTYFLKAVFTLILCGFFSMTYAGTIYLSATGNDTNNGLTAGTAVKSFSAAQTLAADGDTIMVSGMIDFTIDPANLFTQQTVGSSTSNKAGIVLVKNLTIQGTSNATDGFLGSDTFGNNSTRFIQMTTDKTLTLKNIKLANGNINSDSSVYGTGGAINMVTGSIVAENVIFDSNIATGNTATTSGNIGAAIQISNTNASGCSFKNCVFNANQAEKAGAIYITSWGVGSTIKFENCAFTNNIANSAFGGSALYIRANTNANTTLNIINCTFKGNAVNALATNGGTIYIAKSTNTTNVNIINCTISENTTAGSATNTAGLYFHLSDAAVDANVYIKNCIIEGNKTAAGAPADLSLSGASATSAGGTVGYLKIDNSIIGYNGYPLNLNAGNITNSTYNYLTSASLPADYIAKLDAFDTMTNSYPLLDGSPAISYGSTAFLTSLVPSVTTDQLGKTRPSPSCSAGSVEKNPVLGLKKNLNNSILVYRSANNQIIVENTKTDYTGSITVYNTLGQIVAKLAVKGALTTVEKTLNAGVYIVMLNNAEGSFSKKVVLN